ncbi:MAG: MFS transporter [Gaiellales bacterium]
MLESSSARDRRPLLAVFLSDAISLSGNAVAVVAIPWFVLELTGSAALTGVTAFFTVLPTVIALFLGGAIVDRLGFRTTSVIADLASGATVAVIPALHLTVGIEFWQLVVLVFLGALLDAPGMTARESLVPDLAELAGMRLERATGIVQGIHRGSLLVGAPLAGGLIAIIGPANVLWLDASSFLVSAALMRLFAPDIRHRTEGAPSRYVTELLEGLRFVFRDPVIRAVTFTVMLTNFLDAPLFAVTLPVFAREAFGSAVQLGLMIGTFGGLSLLGAIVFSVIGHRLPRRTTFVVSFIFVSLPYLVLSMLPSLGVAIAAMALFGLASAPLNPIINTVYYERVPASMRGRVLGLSNAAAFATMPAGALIAGFLIEAIGVGSMLLVTGLCYLAITSAGLLVPAFREMERPALQKDLRGDLG